MKSILLIGLGRFGRHIAMKLRELNHQVMAVDKCEQRVEDLLPYVTNAQIGDSTNESFLRSLGVSNFDVCIVAIGNDFQGSLETTSLLKELGAKHVVSRAARDVQAKFLLRNGADEVIYPEREMAERVAIRHSHNHLFDQFVLTKDVSIYEISPQDRWIGKSIRETNFRAKYNCSILATKNGDVVTPLPPADYVFKAGEHLMVVGHESDVDKLLK